MIWRHTNSAACGFALAISASCALTSGKTHAAAAPGSPDHPNVVIILADDLGYGDPRCYNPDSKIPTPHLDALALDGMRFMDAHTPSAVCTPTRYALLTGRYAWRTRLKSGVLWGRDRLLIEPGRDTIASMLKRHDYETCCVGKWHLGLGSYDENDPDGKQDLTRPVDAGPHTVGFDYSLVIPASLDIPPYVYFENGAPVEAPTEHTPGSKRRWSGGGGFWREGPMPPGFEHEQVLPHITDTAVEYISKQGADDVGGPFFLYVPLTAPHTPWLPTEEFQGRSEAGWYGDFVAQVDDTIGRVMQALDEAGLADSTLLIVTSDNGAHWRQQEIAEFNHRANGPFRGQKADIHEGGHRVPLIVRWPGKVKPGARSDALVGLNDLYATIASVVGENSDPNAAEDSVSFREVLNGNSDNIRETLIDHSINGTFAIRRGPWKLIDCLGSGGFTKPARIEPGPDDPPGQLYNLDEDPAETRNVYIEHPDIVRELMELLEAERNTPAASPIGG